MTATINHLEVKRNQRVAAANLRLERQLALRRAQEQGRLCTPASIQQGSDSPQFAAADAAAMPERAAALEAGTGSSRSQFPAVQFFQDGRLP